jgi:predicted amidohydrolase YtcJ
MEKRYFLNLCAALIMVAGLTGGNFSWAGDPVADVIFHNGTILTVDKNMTEAEAVAVKDGRILGVGSIVEAFRYKSDATRMIDLGGKTLMPGFVEGHSHPFMNMIVDNMTVDIRPVLYTSGPKIMKIIKTAVAKAAPGEYIVFFGWDPLIQKGLKNPTRLELDALAPNHPVLIIGNSGHVAFANSRAFQSAGITRDTPDPTGPMGGTFGHSKDGELNGRLDQGDPILMTLLPFLKSWLSDPQKAVQQVSTAWQRCASNGITTVDDSMIDERYLNLYRETAKHFPSIRVRGYAVHYKSWKPFEGDDLIKVNGAKVFVDGTPWTGTLFVTKPYPVNALTVKVLELPPGYIQKPYIGKADLQTLVDNCLKEKRTLEIHAQGDAAIDMSLDAIEQGLNQYPWPDHRFRIAHVPMIRDDQLERAKRLGVQVTFLVAHIKYWGDILPTLVGDERGRRWMPVASAKRIGVNYGFHFDGPVAPNKPFSVLETAVTRKTVGGKVLGPEERVTIDDAIRAYTINPAYQLFMEKEVGSIEPGKFADMIIVSDNPRKIAPDKLSKIKVLVTYLNGKEIYRAK